MSNRKSTVGRRADGRLKKGYRLTRSGRVVKASAGRRKRRRGRSR